MAYPALWPLWRSKIETSAAPSNKAKAWRASEA